MVNICCISNQGKYNLLTIAYKALHDRLPLSPHSLCAATLYYLLLFKHTKAAPASCTYTHYSLSSDLPVVPPLCHSGPY